MTGDGGLPMQNIIHHKDAKNAKKEIFYVVKGLHLQVLRIQFLSLNL